MLDAAVLAPVGERVRPYLEAATRLAEGFALSAARHDREVSCPVENFPAIIEAGLHALTVPRRFGGPELDLLETLLVQERLASGDGPTALILAMNLHLVGNANETGCWNEARFGDLCQQILKHGALINSVASEPELGSPSRGGLPHTVARPLPNSWKISGRKTFATGAPVLTHLLVQATLEGSDQVGEFVLPRDRPGLRWDPAAWDVVGMRATASYDLILDEVEAGPSDLLRAFTPHAGVRTWFFLVVAATYLGLGSAAREAAVRYARERKPTNLGGKSIAELESIQTMLGKLENELFTARSALYSLAGAWARNVEARPALAEYVGVVKVRCTEAAVTAADLAMRVAGGASLSRSLPFERLLRDARAGLFHPPNEALALTGLGRALTQR